MYFSTFNLNVLYLIYICMYKANKHYYYYYYYYTYRSLSLAKFTNDRCLSAIV